MNNTELKLIVTKINKFSNIVDKLKLNKNIITLEEVVETIVEETISTFNILEKNDKIMVLMSGGKDSTTVAYILKKLGYNLTALHVNFGYGIWSKQNEENVKKFCESNSIKLKAIKFEEYSGKSMKEIRDILKLTDNRRWCFTCGILRRKLFNYVARMEISTKVATGHNMNDEIQNILMNFLTGNKIAFTRFWPIVKTSKSEKLIPRIKPLFFVPEELIKAYSILKKFPVIYMPCPCSYNAFRGEIEKFINNEITDYKERYKILSKAFLLKEEIKKRIKQNNVKECKLCGEPSSNEICMPCSLMEKYQKAINLTTLIAQ
ncbi:MAG: ATP-binding protein [Candidatus Anstonellales archaeon]